VGRGDKEAKTRVRRDAEVGLLHEEVDERNDRVHRLEPIVEVRCGRRSPRSVSARSRRSISRSRRPWRSR